MSDNKIDTAVISKFDGKNYHQWKFQINCVLRAKGFHNIARGIDVKPEVMGTMETSISIQTAARKKWLKENACIMFLVTSAMDFSQITLIENCQSSKKILEKLDTVYEQKTEINKMLAHERFSQYKMDPNDSIA